MKRQKIETRVWAWMELSWPALIPVAILVVGCVVIGFVNGWS